MIKGRASFMNDSYFVGQNSKINRSSIYRISGTTFAHLTIITYLIKWKVIFRAITVFMKNFISIIFGLFCCCLISAQSPQNFVLKGKVKNPTQDFLEVGVTGFIGWQTINIPIDKNGRFNKTISITHPQDFMFESNDNLIQLFGVPRDTIELSWDGKDFLNSVSASTANPDRQKELNLMVDLSKKSFPGIPDLQEYLDNRNISDSLKFEKIKTNFANQIKLVLAYPLTQYSTKIFCDLYYMSLKMVTRAGLGSKYKLSFADAVPKNIAQDRPLRFMNTETLIEDLFYLSRNYRDFIFDKVRFNYVFTSWLNLIPGNTQPNFTLKDCFSGGAYLCMVPAIQDWYLTKAIMNGFDSYSFEGAEEAYQIFYPRIKTPLFADTLRQFYNNIQRLKPGKEAPAFSLRDEKGKAVSLNDFKGKVVYVDFWGKYCGPCRNDIEKYIPKLHERYKNKNVAFLNICVDVDEKEWKETLKELKLDGTNLLTEGWTTNPVCIDYNIDAIPHYVLIDQKGNIVQNNADDPWQLLDKGKNVIDKLLE
jgi:peroxiredoxin